MEDYAAASTRDDMTTEVYSGPLIYPHLALGRIGYTKRMRDHTHFRDGRMPPKEGGKWPLVQTDRYPFPTAESATRMEDQWRV